MGDTRPSAAADAATELTSFVRNLQVHSGSSSSSSPTHDSSERIIEGIKKLSRRLPWIRATLDVAEERGNRNASDRLWLRGLEGVACEAEDVLEELQYEALRLRMEGRLQGQMGITDAAAQGTGSTVLQVRTKFTSSVRKMFLRESQEITPSREIVAFLRNVEQKIEEINLMFNEISEHRAAFQLEKNDGQRQDELIHTQQRTSSRMGGQLFIAGRGEDLKIVKMFLLSVEEHSKSNSIPVMAIVGVGGLGKTTLAQLACKDAEEGNYFDLMGWVCVSEGFDVVRLTRAMIESFTGEPCHLTQLDSLQNKLKKELTDKQFLLVLDDVWEEGLEGIWHSLVAPLRQDGSNKRSKIIITTRNEEVSRIAGAALTHHLPYLRDEDCLQVFSQKAFEGRGPAALHTDMIAMGKEISKKCAGVPLVANVLGSQLRWVDDVQKWKDIVEGDIWDIGGKGIMPVLRLSYDLLPTYLKRCFKFCSVFPKDYRFDRNHLIQMWMAHDYVQPKGSRQMEDIGKDYFDELLWRSFFQRRVSWESAEIFQMHDLIHDLAKYVSRNEYYSLEDGKPYSNSQHIRHFSIISSKHTAELDEIIGHICLPRTLRSFVFINHSWKCAETMKHLDRLFTITTYLRVLDLSASGIESLPSSIGCLKLLRYLDLPKLVGSSSGRICPELPDGISRLLNLRHVVSDYDVVYPAGIRRLTNLQVMPGFYVSSKHGHAKLGELKDINDIQSLRILGIRNLTSVGEAKAACLEKKVHLRALHLNWSEQNYYREYERSSALDDGVLESLKPNRALESLKVSHFRGRSLPSWLGDRSFSNLARVELFCCDGLKHIGREILGADTGEFPHLQKLILNRCIKLGSLSLLNLVALQVLDITDCTSLEFSPGSLQLCNLPSLQQININGIRGATHISGQLYGGVPSLKTLELERVRQLPRARVVDFSNLRRLEVSNCDELTSLPLLDLEALEGLAIKWCIQLGFSNEDQFPPTLQELWIHGCPLLTDAFQQDNRKLLRIPRWHVQGVDNYQVNLRNVQGVQEAAEIHLSDVECLRVLQLAWDSSDDSIKHSIDIGVELKDVLESLRPHGSLAKLLIQGYAGLSFATWLGDPSFSNLVSITLVHCSNCILLPPLGRLPHLQDLHISGIIKLQRVGTEFFGGCSNSGDGHTCAFPSLRSLEFHDLPISEEWQGAGDGDLPSLNKLTIRHCPKLWALPQLSKLKELEVEASEQLVLHNRLVHLISLQTLHISGIPGLLQLPVLPGCLVQLVLKSLPAVANLQIPLTVRDLTLEGCNEAAIVASLQSLTNLNSLRISQLPELTQPPKLHNLVSLQELDISSCPKLESLDCFYFSPISEIFIEGLQALESLRRLSLRDCPRLCFSANERPPSILQYFAFTHCPLLVQWCDRDLSRLAHIREIYVDGILVSAGESIGSQMEKTI